MGFKFIHASDLHLDTPFVGIAQEATHVAEALREASVRVLGKIVELAIREQVAFVILAGDVYDGEERGIRAQLELLEATRRLDAAGIHTFIAHGNHDPVERGWSAIARWPERVHVFDAGTPSAFRLDLAGGERVTVHGVSFGRRQETENLALRFERPDTDGTHVAVLHANVGAAPEHAPYSPCELSDLESAGFDYWALGHVHRRSILREERPTVAYPGNTQGRSFKPSEQGPKGVLSVRVEGGRVEAPRFHAVDAVRFIEREVAIADGDDLGGVGTKLREAGELTRREHPGLAVVLRARLTGRGGPWEKLVDPSELKELLGILRAGAPGGPAFLWWAELESAVAPPVDLEVLQTRDDFVGELAKEARRKTDRSEARLFAAACANDATVALVQRASAEELAALIEEAGREAAALLRGGE
jgi:exonuclease SbcD